MSLFPLFVTIFFFLGNRFLGSSFFPLPIFHIPPPTTATEIASTVAGGGGGIFQHRDPCVPEHYPTRGLLGAGQGEATVLKIEAILRVLMQE